MNKISAYALETRAGILSTTILPVLIGTAVAYYNMKVFYCGLFLLVLFGFIFLHLGTNVLNDFFDAKDGTDNINKEYVSPFTGGSRLLQQGVLTPDQVLGEAIVLYVLSAGFLIYAAFISGFAILWLATFGMASGIFYSTPPLKLARTGLGEPLIFLNFGPVIVLTSYYSQTGLLGWIPIIISLSMGFLTTNFVWMAQFPDFQADKDTGKRNLVVRFGREKSRILYIIIAAVAYISIIAGVITGMIPILGLAALAALPVSAIASMELWKKYETPSKLGFACGMTLAAQLIAGVFLVTAFLVK